MRRPPAPPALALLTLLGACAPPLPAAPPAPAPASAAPAAPAAPAADAEGLCPGLCALAPAAASPRAPALKGVTGLDEGQAAVVLLWREPNGESIEAIGGLNDLAERLRGLTGVTLALVSIDDDGARATQARRELIDPATRVTLIFGADGQATAAALAPDRLPALYVLDRQRRTVARFEGPTRWRSPATRGFFEGLAGGQGCSLSFDAGKPVSPGRCEGGSPKP